MLDTYFTAPARHISPPFPIHVLAGYSSPPLVRPSLAKLSCGPAASTARAQLHLPPAPRPAVSAAGAAPCSCRRAKCLRAARGGVGFESDSRSSLGSARSLSGNPAQAPSEVDADAWDSSPPDRWPRPSRDGVARARSGSRRLTRWSGLGAYLSPGSCPWLPLDARRPAWGRSRRRESWRSLRSGGRAHPRLHPMQELLVHASPAAGEER